MSERDKWVFESTPNGGGEHFFEQLMMHEPWVPKDPPPPAHMLQGDFSSYAQEAVIARQYFGPTRVDQRFPRGAFDRARKADDAPAPRPAE